MKFVHSFPNGKVNCVVFSKSNITKTGNKEVSLKTNFLKLKMERPV